MSKFFDFSRQGIRTTALVTVPALLPNGERGKNEKRLKDALAALPRHSPLLAQCAEELEILYDRETARRQGTEARLTSILGLSSIAGTKSLDFFLG